MTEQQFNMLTDKLNPARKEAARAVLFDGLSDGAAERMAHGQKTRTVRRDVNRIMSELNKAKELLK